MKKKAQSIDLSKARRKLRGGEPWVVEGVDVVITRIHGRDFQFVTTHDRDPIQRKWRKGVFYEPKELEEIKQFFPWGGTFVDIGANVGNHSLFVAGFMKPGKVIPFEPNPAAYRILMANIAINGFTELFDLRHLGLGLADRAADGFAMDFQPRNLGGTKMRESEEGELEVITGDAALAGEMPDMIKVDVEGMEMQVLGGLEETIARARPILLLEIDDENDAAFKDWVGAHDYDVVKSVRRYQNNTNYVLCPKGGE